MSSKFPWDAVGLSVREFSKLCGGAAAGAAPSTLQSVWIGDATERTAEKVKPLIAQGLRKALSIKGFKGKSLEVEIQTIFTGMAGATVTPDEDNQMAEKFATLSPAQQRKFGFRFDPFAARPVRREDVWTNKDLDEIETQAIYAVKNQHMLGIVGVPGTGKTEMRKRLVDLSRKSGGKMHILFPEARDMRGVRTGAIMSGILRHFEEHVPLDLVARDERLVKLFARLSDNNETVALCFDDAHQLDDRVLINLKRFLEMSDGGYTYYLSVLLFGQPPLEARLADFRFSEIMQRVEMRRLPELTGATGWEYVNWRCRLAGVNAADVIEQAVVEKLVNDRRCKTPLALGNACTALLIDAWATGETCVRVGSVKWKESEMSSSRVVASSSKKVAA